MTIIQFINRKGRNILPPKCHRTDTEAEKALHSWLTSHATGDRAKLVFLGQYKPGRHDLIIYRSEDLDFVIQLEAEVRTDVDVRNRTEYYDVVSTSFVFDNADTCVDHIMNLVDLYRSQIKASTTPPCPPE